MANNLYEKLMSKYEACPDDPMAKFTKCQPKKSTAETAATIAARVKEAIKRGRSQYEGVLTIEIIFYRSCSYAKTTPHLC